MKLDEITVKKDEYYTPPYAVAPIIPYIPDRWRVWCPFDTGHSHFVSRLRANGNEVVASHLDTGHDFFAWEPHVPYDCIVSNPPYSLKNEVFERLFALQKPFAMLVGVVGLFESQRRYRMFRDNPFEIMYLNKRIAFYEDHIDQTPTLNPPFSSVYLCSRLLPNRIMFSEIDK